MWGPLPCPQRALGPVVPWWHWDQVSGISGSMDIIRSNQYLLETLYTTQFWNQPSTLLTDCSETVFCCFCSHHLIRCSQPWSRKRMTVRGEKCPIYSSWGAEIPDTPCLFVFVPIIPTYHSVLSDRNNDRNVRHASQTHYKVELNYLVNDLFGSCHLSHSVQPCVWHGWYFSLSSPNCQHLIIPIAGHRLKMMLANIPDGCRPFLCLPQSQCLHKGAAIAVWGFWFFNMSTQPNITWVQSRVELALPVEVTLMPHWMYFAHKTGLLLPTWQYSLRWCENWSLGSEQPRINLKIMGLFNLDQECKHLREPGSPLFCPVKDTSRPCSSGKLSEKEWHFRTLLCKIVLYFILVYSCLITKWYLCIILAS